MYNYLIIFRNENRITWLVLVREYLNMSNLQPVVYNMCYSADDARIRFGTLPTMTYSMSPLVTFIGGRINNTYSIGSCDYACGKGCVTCRQN